MTFEGPFAFPGLASPNSNGVVGGATEKTLVGLVEDDGVDSVNVTLHALWLNLLSSLL
jgi:hypothetical protein